MDGTCDTADGSEIRRENQLRLVGYPLLYRFFHTSKRWFSRRISIEPSTVRPFDSHDYRWVALQE